MARRYFEDLTLGESWESRAYEITEDEIVAFAKAYDPQPMHTDPELAATGPHGSVISSGWMIASLTLKLFIEAGGYGDTPVMGLGTDELRWSQVVKPGDVIRVRREIVDLRRSRSNPLNGLAKTRISVVNQRGETVMSMFSTGLITARAAE